MSTLRENASKPFTLTASDTLALRLRWTAEYLDGEKVSVLARTYQVPAQTIFNAIYAVLKIYGVSAAQDDAGRMIALATAEKMAALAVPTAAIVKGGSPKGATSLSAENSDS